ncbi:DUF6612 family protein [Sporosarcina cyprini]|uniref:DUF6612 family protein n=1 Tax=Sporosarcina cyprini TaxID=2910523 RepID=UPI001EE0EDF7|nr:DUF6612 family protein [Sporosarcina cyprini]MCG3089010.1 copper amine oxidase N-terminal domain-containing protein [Sporosarcina cyprini]
MRKLATWALAFIFILSFALPQSNASAASNMKLVVDGEVVEGIEQPFMSQGEVLIPIENLFTKAGYQVSKDKTGKLSVTNTYLSVDFDATAGSVTVDGKKTDTPFPLTLKNYGNYVSGTFLSKLEGFDLKVSDDKRTVSVTTNRVKDLDKFLKKMMNADLKSYSAKMTLDQKMESTDDPDVIGMLMDMEMDVTQEPVAIHMKQTVSTDFGGEKDEFTSESYMTEKEFYQYDGDRWIAYGNDFGLGADVGATLNPTAQFELAKMFLKGVHVFEYDDVYVMVQTITTEDLNEMLGEALSLIGSALGGLEISEEALTEDSVTEEAVVEEAVTESTEAEDATADETVLDEDIFSALGIEIEEMYFVTTIDKKTLFPQDMKGTTKISMTIDDVTVKIVQTLTGTMSNFNAVKAIVIPEDVKKEAISFEDYMKELEAELEKELQAAE